MTPTERFDAVPDSVQSQLIRLYRLAAGMSADEKAQATYWLAGIAQQSAVSVADDLVPAAEMVLSCMRVVNELDKVSGSGSSAVVR